MDSEKPLSEQMKPQEPTTLKMLVESVEDRFESLTNIAGLKARLHAQLNLLKNGQRSIHIKATIQRGDATVWNDIGTQIAQHVAAYCSLLGGFAFERTNEREWNMFLLVRLKVAE